MISPFPPEDVVSPKSSVGTLSLVLLAFSLPFLDVAGLGGSAYVKPLVLLIALPAFFFRFAANPKSIALPIDKSMKLALLFWGWAMIGGMTMPWITGAPLEFKGQSLGARILRDLSALSVGFFFWVFVRIELRSTAAIVRAAKLMLSSFWLVSVVCSVQVLVLVSNNEVVLTIDSVLANLRSRQGLEYGKIFGLAPEASMLADQLLTMYLPFMLASMVENTSLVRPSHKRVFFERLMFSLAIVFLIFTRSRIGFITLVGMLACVYLLAPKLHDSRRKRIPVTGVIVIGGIFTAGGLVAGEEFADFFNSFAGIDASISGGIWSNVTRVGSMATGLVMFLDHPLGVGTGAFPFLFERYVPDWALISPEVQALIGTNYDYLTAATGSTGGDIAQRLPDAKALPVRVLAEMGLPGLILLSSGWLYQAKCCWRVALTTNMPVERAVAFGCVLSLLAMLPLSFSVNSYVWVHWLFISAIASSLIRIQHRRQLATRPVLEPSNISEVGIGSISV